MLLPAYTSEQNMLREFSFSVPDRERNTAQCVRLACQNDCNWTKRSSIPKSWNTGSVTKVLPTLVFFVSAGSAIIFPTSFSISLELRTTMQCACSLCWDLFLTWWKLFNLCTFFREIICQNHFHEGVTAPYSEWAIVTWPKHIVVLALLGEQVYLCK